MRDGCNIRSVDLRTKAENNVDKSASPTSVEVFERMRLTHQCGMGWELGAHMTSKSVYLANIYFRSDWWQGKAVYHGGPQMRESLYKVSSYSVRGCILRGSRDEHDGMCGTQFRW